MGEKSFRVELIAFDKLFSPWNSWTLFLNFLFGGDVWQFFKWFRKSCGWVRGNAATGDPGFYFIQKFRFSADLLNTSGSGFNSLFIGRLLQRLFCGGLSNWRLFDWRGNISILSCFLLSVYFFVFYSVLLIEYLLGALLELRILFSFLWIEFSVFFHCPFFMHVLLFLYQLFLFYFFLRCQFIHLSHWSLLVEFKFLFYLNLLCLHRNVQKEESLFDKIFLDIFVKRSISGKTGSVVDLKKRGFQVLIKHDIEAKNMKAVIIGKVISLTQPIEMIKHGFSNK